MSRWQRVATAVTMVALLLAGALGAFVFGVSRDAAPQIAQAQEFYENRGISVQGEGRISVTPDVAHVILGVEVEGSDLESLRDDADSRMSDVIDALEELGIESEDIQTITYDIRVRQDSVEPPPRPLPDEPADSTTDEVEDDAEATPEVDDDAEATPEADDEAEATPEADEDADVTEEADDDATTTTAPAQDEEQQQVGAQSYVLVQLVQVRVADIDMVGDVIDTALDNGANRIGGISFEVEDRQQAIEDAREMAVEEARAKAEHLAELTDVRVGPPLKIDESSPSGPPYRDYYAMEVAEEAAMDDAGARIEPGQQEVTVTVYITYEIE
jgi:uncharacterized protein YggE